jgi:hypothetical protein
MPICREICEHGTGGCPSSQAGSTPKFNSRNHYLGSVTYMVIFLFLYFYQIVAREKTGNAASAPISMTVSLNDVNDNAPKLPMIPPLTVQAGDNKQSVTKVSNHGGNKRNFILIVIHSQSYVE